MIPADLKYTGQHEWLRLEGDIATVGITDFAQEQLTDIVFVDLPEAGRKVLVGDSVAVLESVKSVSDVYSPLAGEVVEVNTTLEANPQLVNEDPFGTGWMVKLKVANKAGLDKLMDSAAYQAYLDSANH
ncbi:MAG: glycine cleavage system protein GcvH [Deltaproteobacteria bacterium]|nr:glycine cleavage system protein GcvH [Deltaproteobacteria bacterium]